MVKQEEVATYAAKVAHSSWMGGGHFGFLYLGVKDIVQVHLHTSVACKNGLFVWCPSRDSGLTKSKYLGIMKNFLKVFLLVFATSFICEMLKFRGLSSVIGLFHCTCDQERLDPR